MSRVISALIAGSAVALLYEFGGLRAAAVGMVWALCGYAEGLLRSAAIEKGGE